MVISLDLKVNVRIYNNQYYQGHVSNINYDDQACTCYFVLHVKSVLAINML